MATKLSEAVDTRTGMVPALVETTAKNIEAVIAECSLDTVTSLGAVQQIFKMARGLVQMRSMITPEMMKDVMALQNSTLGFLTDKLDDGYPEDVVKDVLIDALFHGARMVNNEVNIINKKPYYTKNFFARKIRQFPGLTDYRRSFGVPRSIGDRGAMVMISAKWNLNGIPGHLTEREIPIKINSGMGSDAVLGKAKRKLDAAVYGQLTDSDQSDGEIDDETAASRARNITPTAEVETGSRSESLAAKLAMVDTVTVDPPKQSVTSVPLEGELV